VALDHSECDANGEGCKHRHLLPEYLELVGGPYDGFQLHPAAGHVYTVLDQLPQQQFPGSTSMPNNFMIWDTDLLLMMGNAGEAVYRMESEHLWKYVPYTRSREVLV
jgi:hypothetical protein